VTERGPITYPRTLWAFTDSYLLKYKDDVIFITNKFPGYDGPTGGYTSSSVDIDIFRTNYSKLTEKVTPIFDGIVQDIPKSYYEYYSFNEGYYLVPQVLGTPSKYSLLPFTLSNMNSYQKSKGKVIKSDSTTFSISINTTHKN
jgi:hypothetical protein